MGSTHSGYGWCTACRRQVVLPCRLCHVRDLDRRGLIPRPRPVDPSLSRELREKLEASVAELDLPVRVINCLQTSDIFTVNDLVHTSQDQLLQIPTFAHKTVSRIVSTVRKFLGQTDGR